jgi:hypothetical protein
MQPGPLMFRLLADVMVILHLAFILFVAGGGVLVLRWPRLALLHLPAVCWGIVVLSAGWVCPLTPAEIYFRRKSGGVGYGGGFIGHYLLPLIYPENITRTTQISLALGVLLFNSLLYGLLLLRLRKKR